MGMSTSNGHYNGPQGRRKRRNRHAPISEINMTPMVDVMLVLLIIFMVAAPMLTTGVPIELPEAQAAALASNSEPLSISVGTDGKIYIQEAEIAFEDLSEKLKALSKNGFKEKIFVRGDKSVAYGEFMKVIAHINDAGYKSIGLVTTDAAATN